MSKPGPMDRRRFLTTTAIGVTAFALTREHALAAASGSFVPLMSVGFAPALPANGSFVRLSGANSRGRTPPQRA